MRTGPLHPLWVLGALAPTLFSIFHGLRLRAQNPKERLLLSVWSAILGLAALNVVLEYFLLGAAAPYLLHNAVLLIVGLKVDHLSRISEAQVSRKASAAALLLLSAILGSNYVLRVLSPGTAIWMGLLGVSTTISLSLKFFKSCNLSR